MIDWICYSCRSFIILLLIKQCSGQWKQISQHTNSSPAHTFQISHFADDSVQGVLSWTDNNTDLDLYVYNNNQPLFNSNRAVRNFTALSFNDRMQPFQFSSIQTNTGILYLRVHPFAVSSIFLNYQIKISINNTRTGRSDFYEYFGSVYREQKFMSYVNLGSLGLLPGYIKFEINGTTDISIRIPRLSSSDITIGASVYLPSKPDSTWVVIFTHPTANINNLQSYTYRIFYNPQNAPPDPNNGIATTSQNSSAAKIVGGVIGSVAFVIILIIIYVVYRKRQRSMIIGNDETAIVVPQGQQINIRPNRGQICSICLDYNPNARLPCMHRFHDGCIRQWVILRQKCPMCRRVSRIADIGIDIPAN